MSLNSQLSTINCPPDRAAVVGNGSTNGTARLEPHANILLVDDRTDKLLALGAILEPLGENLVKARSGKEALRLLLKQDFAVILLDVSMPGMDGFETAALIRQRLKSEHTPIIFVTAVGETDNHVSRGYSLGAVDYLLTPIMPEVLRTKVSVLVELYKKTEVVRLQAEQLRQAEESRHQREMAEVVDRLEIETRRNRFFNLAVDVLAICNFEGQFLQCNPAWEQVLGYSPAELAGKPVCDLLEAGHVRRTQEQLRELSTGETPVSSETLFRHKDGSCRWLGWTAVPFRSEDLIYVFARDITSRKEAETKIQFLNLELEQRVADLTRANAELETFNYSIAHDLRTPLRSMSGFAQALEEEESDRLTPQGKEYAARIGRSAKFMDALLLDMLAYSGMSRAEMPCSALDLDLAVRETLEHFSREISEKGAGVVVTSPLRCVQANPAALTQILSNLIGNGLKFTVPGKAPRLRIYSTARDGFLRLCVEDNGIGIRSEHQERIFGLFQRLHDAQAYPGTGIGLALVRKSAERMGGRAGVESKPGQGSCFWVELPLINLEKNHNG